MIDWGVKDNSYFEKECLYDIMFYWYSGWNFVFLLWRFPNARKNSKLQKKDEYVL